MKKFLILLFCFISLISFAKELNVLYMNQAGYSPKEMKEIVREFEDKTGSKVKITYAPYEDMHKNILRSAVSKKAVYDVVLEDLIWTAEFAEKGYVMSIDDKVTKEMLGDIPPAILDAFRYNGKLWAMPFLVNFQLFFYNDEILKKAGITEYPKTIEDMTEQMKIIKEKKIVEYPWSDSWNEAEGLICEYVWLTAAFGGETFDEKGKAVFNKGGGLKALEYMRMLLDEGLANPKSLDMNEDMTRDNFVEGKAAFNSNWPYQYAKMQEKKIGKMATLPVSKDVLSKYDTVTVSGYQGIAVMENSQNKDLAWEYVKFVTSPEIQKRNTNELPIWKSLLEGEEIKKNIDNIEIRAKALSHSHHRPRVPEYTKISKTMQRYIHKALKGEMTPKEALDKAAAEINK